MFDSFYVFCQTNLWGISSHYFVMSVSFSINSGNLQKVEEGFDLVNTGYLNGKYLQQLLFITDDSWKCEFMVKAPVKKINSMFIEIQFQNF